MNDHSKPTWENQLWHARKVLKEKGRNALDNPNGMIGRTCKCGTCYCCAAAFIVAEADKADGGAALKREICDALAAWIRRRPKLNARGYYDTSARGEILKAGLAAYCRTQRELARDKRDAETLLAVVRNRDSITVEMLLEASKQAYAGRLSLTPGVADVIEYTAGQDPTTEYRAAAASVLAYAIRHTAIHEARARKEEVDGDWVRSHFRKEFGSALQRRWFN